MFEQTKVDDSQQQFIESCDDFKQYPLNLLQNTRLHHLHRRDDYFESLEEKKETLFSKFNTNMQLLKSKAISFDLDQSAAKEAKDLEDLMKCLNPDRADPMVRYAFMQPAHSRSELDCSQDMFKYLLSFHQVEESFLDCVYTFGKQDAARDLCLTTFKASDTLASPASDIVSLSVQRRSGREVRMSYLLRSVESSGPGIWSWRIRPAAVYHSLDVLTGRSFWISIKGDGIFYRRIKRFHESLESRTTSAGHVGMPAIMQGLQVSLATHLFYLSWCDENWREYINHFESEIVCLVQKARVSPIDDHLGEGGPQLTTFPKSVRHDVRPSKELPRWHVMFSGARKSWRTTRARLKRSVRQDRTEDWPVNEAPPPDSPVTTKTQQARIPPPPTMRTDPREILDKFRLGDVQMLHELDDQIEKAILTIKLDCETIKEIQNYYDGLKTRLRAFDLDGHDSIIEDFASEVQSIIRMLRTHQTQLEYMECNIRQTISLYNDILRYRDLHTSQIYAEKSEETVDKSSKETTSMHIITICTLIFLPGTFVSTLAQSGIFIWGETGDYKISNEGLRLFFGISLPLMAITLLAWYVKWRRD